MAEPFLGEIKLVSFNFPPNGWALCNGQLLPINQNAALFALLGTFYGGNGTSNFQLPNIQGSVLAHPGGDFVQGEVLGEANHTLIQGELPAHAHTVEVGGSGTATDPSGSTFGVPAINARLNAMYSTTAGASASGAMIGSTGGSQPHNNLQPYLVMNYIIALQGIFPSRN